MFDKCLSKRIDMLHAKLDEVRRWPNGRQKLRKVLLLRRALRKLQRRIPAR